MYFAQVKNYVCQYVTMWERINIYALKVYAVEADFFLSAKE